jgi:hypothetical protein
MFGELLIYVTVFLIGLVIGGLSMYGLLTLLGVRKKGK